jgi:CheY-like chemotaxis protein
MSERDTTNLKVLLVEDIDDVRDFMRLELEQHGYRVIEAGDGHTAIELAIQEIPDIILMDLSLPGMDGISATSQIRTHDELRNVPIVAVTAHQETDFRDGARASDFDAYVTKPIDFDWLSDLIPRLVS